MSKQEDVDQALALLKEQIDDKNLPAKDRQAAARAVLSFHKEAVRRYESGAKTHKKNDAVAAAERLTRVK